MASRVVEHRCTIGNISPTTNDQSLETAFRQYGEIVEATVTSSKAGTCGTVVFRNEEAMRAAINNMDGKILGGYPITVAEAATSSGGRFKPNHGRSR